jgi:hypothetical protein
VSEPALRVQGLALEWVQVPVQAWAPEQALVLVLVPA